MTRRSSTSSAVPLRPLLSSEALLRPHNRDSLICSSSDDEAAAKRHSRCSTDSLDSGIDMTPPATRRRHVKSSLAAGGRRASIVACDLRSSMRTARRKKSVSFHPTVRLWTAAECGDFQELFDVLADSRSRTSDCLHHRAAPTGNGDVSSGHAHACACCPDLNTANRQHITLLHLCAFAGSAKCVRLLLELGADLTARDDDGWTPLHAAATGGHDDVVQVLAAFGADLVASDYLGRRAVDVAGKASTRSLLAAMQRRRREARTLSMVVNGTLHTEV